MDTWKKVLTLKLENGEPYGAYTTKDCPFFVVWTRSTEDNRESEADGRKHRIYRGSKRKISPVPIAAYFDMFRSIDASSRA